MIKRFLSVVDIATQVILVLLTGVVLLEVGGRFFFNHPFVWSAEIASLLFPWTIFLGAIIATHEKKHLAINEFVNMMPHSIQKCARFIQHVCALVLCGYLVLGGWEMSKIAVTMERKTTVLYWPLVLFYAALLVGMGGVTLIYILDLFAGNNGDHGKTGGEDQ